MELPSAAHALVFVSLGSEGHRRSSTPTSYAVPALALAELAQRGRVDLVDKRVVARDRSRTGVTLLDDMLERIAAEPKQHKADRLLRKLRSGADLHVLRELEEMGLVCSSKERWMALVPTTRYPVRDREALRTATLPLNEQLLKGRPADERTVLVGLGLEIARLEKQVLGADYKLARQNAHQAAERGTISPVTAAVAKAGLKLRQSMEAAAAS